jgi:hypothetical protein
MKFWAPWREEGRDGKAKNCDIRVGNLPSALFHGILIFSSTLLLGQGFGLRKRNETLGTLERGRNRRENGGKR